MQTKIENNATVEELKEEVENLKKQLSEQTLKTNLFKQHLEQERAGVSSLNALLDTLLESNSNVSTFTIDCNYNYLSFNKKHSNTIKKLVNVDIKIGQNILTVLEGYKHLSNLKKNFDRALSGEAFTFTEKYKENQTWVHSQSNYTPIVDGHNKISGIVVHFTDVTKIKQAEETLHVLLRINEQAGKSFDLTEFLSNTHQLLLGLLDATNFYVSLYEKESDTYVFPYFADQFDDIKRNVHLKLSKGLTAYVRKTAKPLLINEKDITDLKDAGHVNLIGTLAKSWLGVPLLINNVAIGVMTVQNYEYKNIYTVKDLDLMVFIGEHIAKIVQRKKYEQELKEREISLKIAQTIAKLGNWEYNLVTKQFWASEQIYEIIGVEETEKDKLAAIFENIHLQHRRTLKVAALKLLTENKKFDVEFQVKNKKENKYLTLQTKATVINDEDNNALKLLGIAQDITEMKNNELKLKEAKEKAEEADMLKTAFLANMSHEIRTPMNAIIGFSELLTDPELTEESKVEYVNYINNSGNNLLRLIDDIIDIAKIEAGQIRIEKTTCFVNSLLDELKASFDDYKEKIGKFDVEIQLAKSNSSSNFAIYTDPIRLRQILTNFISNALKFTDYGYIKIGYKFSEKKGIVFFVEDTGIGIPKDKFNIVFERFGQVETSLHKLYGGTGLGLSIAKNLIELLDGKIWLESELNKGTTFYFEIPFIEISKPEVIQKQKIYDNFDLTGKNILIVEDEEMNYQLLKETLKSCNCNTIRAINGEVAVQIALEFPIDLILMDMQIPIINGYEATKIIKNEKPNIPIIAQTAYAFSDERTKTIAAGCNAYVSKPINTEELKNLIKLLLHFNK